VNARPPARSPNEAARVDAAPGRHVDRGACFRAQPNPTPVIGSLSGASPGPYAPFVAALLQGLSETGYVEGRNLAIECRFSEGRYDRLSALALDLVSRKVDLLLALDDGAVVAAKNATSTVGGRRLLLEDIKPRRRQSRRASALAPLRVRGQGMAQWRPEPVLVYVTL
jgi:hypothetical protein